MATVRLVSYGESSGWFAGWGAWALVAVLNHALDRWRSAGDPLIGGYCGCKRTWWCLAAGIVGFGMVGAAANLDLSTPTC